MKILKVKASCCERKMQSLKGFFFKFMFASFQPVVSPFSVRLIKQVKLSSLITR